MSETLVPTTPKPTARRAGAASARPPRAAAGGRARKLTVDRAPDHHADDVVAHGIGPIGLAGVAAVLQHSDAIGDREYLVHPMADEHDGAALLAQAPHHVEQLLHFVLAQPRRRFIEDEDRRVAGHRLGDLDQLALGQRQLADRQAGIDVHAEKTQQLARAAPQGAPVDQPEARRLLTDEDVGGHVHLGEQGQLLGHPGDAQVLGAARRQRVERAALDLDRSAVRGDDAGEHLHQG